VDCFAINLPCSVLARFAHTEVFGFINEISRYTRNLYSSLATPYSQENLKEHFGRLHYLANRYAVGLVCSVFAPLRSHGDLQTHSRNFSIHSEFLFVFSYPMFAVLKDLYFRRLHCLANRYAVGSVYFVLAPLVRTEVFKLI